MADLLLHLPLFHLVLTVLSIVILTLVIKGKGKRGSKLPPSPWKLPIIGNLHHLLGAGDPHRAFHRLSNKCGPIMHLKMGQIDLIVISSPDAAREILKTHDINFASRPQLTVPTMVFNNLDIAFAPYGSYWRHIRKICVLELLSARRVKSFLHIRERENSALLASIMTMSTGKPVAVNLTEKFFLLSSTTVAMTAVGMECKQGTRLISESKKAIALLAGFNLADLYPSLSFVNSLLGITAKIERIVKNFDEILDEIIEDHQSIVKNFDEILDEIIEDHQSKKLAAGSKFQEEEEDLLDVLLRQKDDGGHELGRANIQAVVLDMLVAGTETTASTMIWAMAELMRHAMVMEKVQAEVRRAANGKGRIEEGDLVEMPYLKLIIKETLRLHPTSFLLPRVCEDTCNISGYEIPSGCRVLVNAWAIARDPRYWEKAERFIPERFEGSSVDFRGQSFQYLPFGGGRRICPAMVFGLANVELALAQLLFHFDWGLPDGNELDMTESFGLTLSKKLDLCLIATPWFPLPCYGI